MKKKQLPKLSQEQSDFINQHYNQIVNTIKSMVSKKYHMFYDAFCEKIDNISSFIADAVISVKEDKCKDLQSKIAYVARKCYLLDIDSKKSYNRAKNKYINSIVPITNKLRVFDRYDYNKDIETSNFISWMSKTADSVMDDLMVKDQKKDLFRNIILRSKILGPNDANYISMKELCKAAKVNVSHTSQEVQTILYKIGQIIYYGENRQQYNGCGRDVKPDVAK